MTIWLWLSGTMSGLFAGMGMAGLASKPMPTSMAATLIVLGLFGLVVSTMIAGDRARC